MKTLIIVGVGLLLLLVYWGSFSLAAAGWEFMNWIWVIALIAGATCIVIALWRLIHWMKK
jgi:hypothetical protein